MYVFFIIICDSVNEKVEIIFLIPYDKIQV